MAASVSAMEAVGPEEAIPTMTASFSPIALARSPPRPDGGSAREALAARLGVSSIARPPHLQALKGLDSRPLSLAQHVKNRRACRLGRERVRAPSAGHGRFARCGPREPARPSGPPRSPLPPG